MGVITASVMRIFAQGRLMWFIIVLMMGEDRSVRLWLRMTDIMGHRLVVWRYYIMGTGNLRMGIDMMRFLVRFKLGLINDSLMMLNNSVLMGGLGVRYLMMLRGVVVLDFLVMWSRLRMRDNIVMRRGRLIV